MRESEVEKYFNKRVKELGGETRKMKFIGRRGAPDRAAFFTQGRLYWVELKRPKKSAEEHQEREHERLRALGQSVFVINTKERVDLFCTFIEEYE